MEYSLVDGEHVCESLWRSFVLFLSTLRQLVASQLASRFAICMCVRVCTSLHPYIISCMLRV